MQGTLETKDYKHFKIGSQGPSFEGATAAGRAFPGDTVIWIQDHAELLARAPGPLFLVGTLELAAKVRYGMTSRGAPIYRFVPFNSSN